MKTKTYGKGYQHKHGDSAVNILLICEELFEEVSAAPGRGVSFCRGEEYRHSLLALQFASQVLFALAR